MKIKVRSKLRLKKRIFGLGQRKLKRGFFWIELNCLDGHKSNLRLIFLSLDRITHFKINILVHMLFFVQFP